jgi:hypothetical protein
MTTMISMPISKPFSTVAERTNSIYKNWRLESVDLTTLLDTKDSEPSWHDNTIKVQVKNRNMRVSQQEAI